MQTSGLLTGTKQLSPAELAIDVPVQIGQNVDAKLLVVDLLRCRVELSVRQALAELAGKDLEFQLPAGVMAAAADGVEAEPQQDVRAQFGDMPQVAGSHMALLMTCRRKAIQNCETTLFANKSTFSGR